MHNTKKSQIFTTDFFIAFFIFSVLLIITMISWNDYNSKLEKNIESDILETKAFQISNVLVKSEGSPTNWDYDDVLVIGLAEFDRILSIDKVNSFVSFPINKTNDLLQTHNFNFSFILKETDGDIIFDYGYNISNPKRSVSVRRYVVYNNAEAIAEFNLWENK